MKITHCTPRVVDRLDRRFLGMSIPHLPANAHCEDVLTAIEEAGGVVIDRVVSPEFMDQLAAELRPWIENTPTGTDEFEGRRTRRTGGLIARSPRSRELVMHPLILGIAKQILSRATSVQLNATQAITVGPGEPAQVIHRDQWAFDMYPFSKDYQVLVNCIWAMTDFTAQNGATRVVVGSHKLEDKLQFTEADTEPAEMTKGSVFMYPGTTYHGAGANRSNASRTGISLSYSVSWLRQEENQYLAVPVEIVRTLPEELLRLIGYQRGAYALGYVDDLRDPMEFVRPDLAKRGMAR
jgi:ectoine hydroxylase-related dioxygenase (phytanoyl-CoA dioxygenase family)